MEGKIDMVGCIPGDWLIVPLSEVGGLMMGVELVSLALEGYGSWDASCGVCFLVVR